MATPVLGHSEKSPSEYKSPQKRASNYNDIQANICKSCTLKAMSVNRSASPGVACVGAYRVTPSSPPPPPQSTQLEQLEDQSAEHIAAHSTFDTILLSVLGVWGFHALSSPSVGHKNSYRHTSPWPLTIVSTAIRSCMQLEEAPLCLG